MGLFGRKKQSVGLDIGSGFVKVVVVDHSGDQPEVSWGRHASPGR